MGEYTANDVQTINPGEAFVFTTTTVRDFTGLIQHSDGTTVFNLSGRQTNGCSNGCCNRNQPANYLVDFKTNIAISEGGTAGPISVAISTDGNTVPASQMDSTPAAAQEFNSVSVGMSVPIFNNCCQNISVRNISSQPIDARNSILRIVPPSFR